MSRKFLIERDYADILEEQSVDVSDNDIFDGNENTLTLPNSLSEEEFFGG